MAETLTYSDDSGATAELNADEQESLQVGEQMEQEQSSLLAGKYNSPEALEQAYLELQQKLGRGSDEQDDDGESYEDDGGEEQEDGAEYEYTTDVLDALWEESQQDGEEYSEELSQALSELDVEDIASLYLEQRQQSSEPTDFSDDEVEQLQALVGGEDEYSQMISWAQENADENEIQLFDSVMESGDAASAYFAIRAMSQRWVDAQGYDGELLQGKAARSSGTQFRSQAELVQAMSDPRYETDDAYRNDVLSKLANSNLDF